MEAVKNTIGYLDTICIVSIHSCFVTYCFCKIRNRHVLDMIHDNYYPIYLSGLFWLNYHLTHYLLDD